MIHPRRPAGFTLFELILASAIMAVLLLSLYSAMRTGFKARDKAMSAMGPARAAEVAMDLVRQELESALPPKGILAISFYGMPGAEVPGSAAVEFFAVPRDVTPDPNDPTTFGGVGRVELLLSGSRSTPGSSGATLVRRVSRNLLAPTELPPVEEVLCRDVSAFAMRFYDGTQWHEEWDSTQFEDTLPIAVEVSLALTPANSPTYTTTRTFFLPCRDEGALLAGGVQ